MGARRSVIRVIAVFGALAVVRGAFAQFDGLPQCLVGISYIGDSFPKLMPLQGQLYQQGHQPMPRPLSAHPSHMRFEPVRQYGDQHDLDA